MNVTITVNEKHIQVVSPYNPDFPGKARALGGKWKSPAWVFDIRDEERVRDLCRDVYGEDGRMPVDTVTIRCTATRRRAEGTGGIFLGGRQLAYATGRDSGARLGGGVIVLEGAFNSGGSVKNWVTQCAEGTVFEVRDLPRAKLADVEAEDWVTCTVLEGGVDLEKLRAEREALVARLAEVDEIMRANGGGH